MTAAAGDHGRGTAWLDEPRRRAARATFPFETTERFVWAYTPDPREGLAIRDMRPDQRAAASAIVSLGDELPDRRRDRGDHGAGDGPRRARAGRAADRAGRVATPSCTGSRCSASRHVGAVVVAGRRPPYRHPRDVAEDRHRATPSFLGANPAVVPSAARRQEDAAGGGGPRGVLLSELTPPSATRPSSTPSAPADILTGTGRLADLRSVPVGVRHADLGSSRRAAFERLIRHYVDRIRPDVADAAWERIVAAGLGDVTFAWAGPDAPGRGHYYAIRGPSFVIEYDNTQNGANHIHAVWRDLDNDWGEDVLASTWQRPTGEDRELRRDRHRAWRSRTALRRWRSPGAASGFSGLDRFGRAHGLGSSGGRTRIMRLAYFERTRRTSR